MEITRQDCQRETLYQMLRSLVEDLDIVRNGHMGQASDLEGLYNVFLSLVGDLSRLQTSLLNRVFVHGGFAPATGEAPTKMKTSGATHYVRGGALETLIATDNIALPECATGADEYASIAVTINPSGALALVAGEVSGSYPAPLPDLDPGALLLGWVEVPPSFTAGTGVVTSEMLKPVSYAGDEWLDTSAEDIPPISSQVPLFLTTTTEDFPPPPPPPPPPPEE